MFHCEAVSQHQFFVNSRLISNLTVSLSSLYTYHFVGMQDSNKCSVARINASMTLAVLQGSLHSMMRFLHTH
jgi:hypothetical protein